MGSWLNSEQFFQGGANSLVYGWNVKWKLLTSTELGSDNTQQDGWRN